jgi:tetratricopeptide (TPR) repeat protein
MKVICISIAMGALILAMLSSSPEPGLAQEPGQGIPDKALCSKMLRFGVEAYERGRYLDAKEYFRKAVQADPTSADAWKYYDQSVISALAEKVEKDANLILPDVSSRKEHDTGPALPQSPPPPPKPAPAEKDKGIEFKILEDEGC